MNNYKKIIFSCFLVFLFSLNFCYGAGLLPTPTGGGTASCAGSECGNYTLNDIMSTATKIAAWILSITGSLTLLFFIYGGTMFLISGGSQERVTKAKSILSGAVIGAVIVLTSFIIINFLIFSLTGSYKVNGVEWYKIVTAYEPE